jgi:hypothetical protein
MLKKKSGEVLTPRDLKLIRRKLNILSAKETNDPCGADKNDSNNFLNGLCAYCGVVRKLHLTKNK